MRAGEDMQAITDRLFEEGGEDVARLVAVELRRRFRYLAEVPWMGHRRSEIAADEKVRFFPVFAYLIAYAPDSRPVTILRVLHGARDPEELRSELADDEPEPPGPLSR